MRVRPSGSLRRRFLAVVLCGAVFPLALAGSWLARSSVRSAEGLLRTQLDTSLTTIATNMELRWDYRRGDLLMWAGNDVTLRTLRANAAAPTADDSAYVTRVYAAVSTAIPALQLRAPDGQVRWQFGESNGGARATNRDSVAGARATRSTADERIAIAVPIHADSGPAFGTVVAEVRLSAILPVDSIPILLNGAQLTVTDDRTGRALSFPGLGDAPSGAASFDVNGERWLAQHRTLTGARLTLTAAAPTRAFVAPFEQSARIGLVVLLAVIASSLALTVFFTARITRSIERLASAADAVAAGDLTRQVETNGDDEVGQLARSFNTMTDSLRDTLQQLSQREALAAVGEFATSLSHEVRNGLMAVRVDLERAEESGPSAPESPALVSRALRNVLRVNGTVTGALAVARSRRAASEPVNLVAVVASAAAAAESAFRASGSTLHVDCGDRVEAPVDGDAAALEQMLLNVLLNAGQAMSLGGVATLSLASVDQSWIVSLRDNGPGMSAAQLARVGEAFVTSKRDGTGLGLFIARKIAETHGGSMTLENAVGAGLLVTMRLPKAGSTT
jgi:signal transduction histidine kinase